MNIYLSVVSEPCGLIAVAWSTKTGVIGEHPFSNNYGKLPEIAWSIHYGFIYSETFTILIFFIKAFSEFDLGFDLVYCDSYVWINVYWALVNWISFSVTGCSRYCYGDFVL